MTVINFPDAPIAGERFTIGEITYEWRTEGYWKSIEASIGSASPDEFAFLLDFVPSGTTQTLYRLDMGTGQTLNIETQPSFALLGSPPATDQIYDVYINEVLASDTITVTSAGAISFSMPRSPFSGPITIKIKVNSATVIDAAFAGFGLLARVVTV